MNTAPSRLDRIEHLLPDVLHSWKRPMQLRGDLDLPTALRIDVTENDLEYLVTAEIPGAKKDDVRVSIDGSHVSISAEIKKDQKRKHGRFLLRETYRGTVSRGFSLANEINSKSATATLEDGILCLTLPKRNGGTHHFLKIR